MSIVLFAFGLASLIACGRSPMPAPIADLPFERVTFPECAPKPQSKYACEYPKWGYPQVSTDDARAIVQVEFARVGVRFEPGHQVPAVREFELFDSMGEVYKRRDAGPLVLDGDAPEHRVGFVFIGAWDQGRFGGSPCGGRENPEAISDLATDLTRRLAAAGRPDVAVFHDPIVRMPFNSGHWERDTGPAREALRSQVREYVTRWAGRPLP